MNLFKDSGKMQRDWQIAGWSVTPKSKTRNILTNSIKTLAYIKKKSLKK